MGWNIGGSNQDCSRLQDDNRRLQDENVRLQELVGRLQNEKQNLEQARANDKVIYAASKASLNDAKAQISEMNTVIAGLQARCVELEQELRKKEDEMMNVTPPEYKPVEPLMAPVAPAIPMSADMREVTERLDRLTDLVREASYKDGIIKDLHSALQEQQSDFMAKMIRPYMMSVIKIHDRLVSTERAVGRDEVMMAPDAARMMLNKIKADRLMVADLLEDDYDLEYFEPKPGDAYDPKAHNAIQSLEPPFGEPGSTVVECRQGGFRDLNTGKAVKPAVIVVYKSAHKPEN